MQSATSRGRNKRGLQMPTPAAAVEDSDSSPPPIKKRRRLVRGLRRNSLVASEAVTAERLSQTPDDADYAQSIRSEADGTRRSAGGEDEALFDVPTPGVQGESPEDDDDDPVIGNPEDELTGDLDLEDDWVDETDTVDDPVEAQSRFFPRPSPAECENKAIYLLDGILVTWNTVEQRAEALLRSILMFLQQWAHSQGDLFWGLPRSQRAVTRGYFALLMKVSIDMLLELYMPAIPFEMKLLMIQSSWSAEDFLALPEEIITNFPGVYSIIATLQRGFESYMGSTMAGMMTRKTQHRTILAKRLEDLHHNVRRSMLYSTICREDVASVFKDFAIFTRPIKQGYVFLLESISMIIFDTYTQAGDFTHFMASQASYDLVKACRAHVNLPKAPWATGGLNNALPLYQGFHNLGARSESECCNTSCNRETKNGDGRVLTNPQDPINGEYICASCAWYQSQYMELPDEVWVSKSAMHKARKEKRPELRKERDEDPACDECGQLESVDVKRVSSDSDDWEVRKLLNHSLFPDNLFCHACVAFIETNHRRRTADEISKLNMVRDLKLRRDQGQTILCEHCGEIETDATVKFVANTNYNKVVCRACEGYFNVNNKPRPLNLNTNLKFLQGWRAKRKQGIFPTCTRVHDNGEVCGKDERDGKKKHMSIDNGIDIFCYNCHDMRRRCIKKGTWNGP